MASMLSSRPARNMLRVAIARAIREARPVVDRFRGAIADHQPHTLSSPAKACGDRQDERFDRTCWLGRHAGHYARHDCGSIEPHQDLGLANLDLLDQGSHEFAKLE